LITRLDHGQGPTRVIELRLARPPVNALDPGLIGGLREALALALKDGAAGVVLSGAPGTFSGGLDVPALLKLDRAALGHTWQQFFGLLSDLAHCPVPVCAALTGHSPAGGTVLALFADYRVHALDAHQGARQCNRIHSPSPGSSCRSGQHPRVRFPQGHFHTPHAIIRR
jgi:enoyl-CoA hydratase/carnithine racemase